MNRDADPCRMLTDKTRTVLPVDFGGRAHYLSVAAHPFYQERFGWKPECWPNANRIGSQTVSLPFSPALTDEDVEDVVAAVYWVLQ